MPKKPNDPHVEDDWRFFTVHQPYPLSANWQFEDDQIRCARWIAECIGSTHLYAIHYKPTARNMILLEVAKAFTDHGRLLGEHRWSEMLKDPTEEEKDYSSRIFHSFYSTSRGVQKDGWKCLPVFNKWFEGWQPGKEAFRQPYPETRWCSVPVEDKTNKPLCRPLPREQKTPPPRGPAPVVGSEQWVEKHSSGAPSAAALSADWAASKPVLSVTTASKDQGKVSKQLASATAPGTSAISPQSSGPAGITTASGNNANAPASASGPAPKTKGSWGKPVPLKQFNAPEQRSGKSTWEPVPPAAPPGSKNPLKEEKPKGPINAWTKPLKIPPSERPPPPKGAPTPSPVSNSPWSQDSVLAPASPWGTSASLTSPASASPHEPLPQVTNASAPTWKNNDDYKDADNGVMGSKNNKKRDGNHSQGDPEIRPPASRERPPHQPPQVKEQPMTSSNSKEGGDDGLADLENEFLHPWETRGAEVMAAWGAPPGLPAPAAGKQDRRGGGPRNGPQQGGQKSARGPGQAGGNTKWGEKGKNRTGPGAGYGGGGQARHNGPRGDRDNRDNRDSRDKGRGRENKSASAAAASWSYEPTASNSWGEEPLKTDQMDWKVESTPANDWGNAELKTEWTSNEPSANDWGNAELKTDWISEPSANDWGNAELKTDWTTAESSTAENGGKAHDQGAQKDEHMDKADEGKGKEANTSNMTQDWGGGAPASLNDWGFEGGTSTSNNDWATAPLGSTSEPQLDWSGDPVVQGDWGTLPAGTEFPDWQPDQTLWGQTEEKPLELICPTHNIACKKGICRDMAKLVREQERKQKMEEKRRTYGAYEGSGGRGGGRGGGGGRGRGRGGYAGNRDNGSGQVDEDGYVKPHKKTRRGKKWYEKSFIGKMRAFAEEDKKAAAGVGAEDGETAEADASQVGDEGDDRDEQ